MSHQICSPAFEIRLALLVLAAVLIPSAARSEEDGWLPMNVTLPQSIEGWSLSGPPNRVEPKSIFDYMDGAGELYLGYRFNFLDVYLYKSPGLDDILVELYWMKTSDDAWGLLSGDWGGESLDIAANSNQEKPSEIRALYGAGLLRVWSGNLYARILALQETDSSKRAVLAIGRAVISGRSESKPPRLIQALPRRIGDQFFLKSDRIVFLRSHLVLNSVYFLSQENLLDLGLNCELAAATYQTESNSGSSKSIRILLVQYPDDGAARSALAHFHRVYLPEKSSLPIQQGMVSVEDLWLGYVQSGRHLGLVFEAPEETSTRLLIENVKQALDRMEVNHE